MSVIVRSLVSDQVFRALIEEIVSGRYAAGEKLPAQRALAADFGVNMASIREALKRLEQLRLVEVRHGDAMRVRDWRSEGSLDVLVHLLLAAGGLDLPTFRAVLEARRLMLSEAARLAAERRTPEQVQRLEGLAERFAAERDPAAAQLIDLAFMTELVEASQNVVFVLILNTVRRLYLENAHLFGAMVGDGPELAPLYRQVARGVAGAEPARAAGATARLTAEQERRLIEALG